MIITVVIFIFFKTLITIIITTLYKIFCKYYRIFCKHRSFSHGCWWGRQLDSMRTRPIPPSACGLYLFLHILCNIGRSLTSNDAYEKISVFITQLYYTTNVLFAIFIIIGINNCNCSQFVF